MKALAIIPVRNEADILADCVAHLVRQGVQCYVVDNWSTDGSWEMLPSLPLVGFERFPKDGPEPDYSCRRIHRRIDEIAAASDADWCVFHDADEIRRSCRNETLAEGFARVESEGYNAVNHKLYLFHPVDNAYRGDPERHFRHYITDHIDCANGHVKSWKNQHTLVNLGVWETGGGHFLMFPGVRVHPEPWILKHYPIRSQLHGECKMRDRHSRWNREEKQRGWHVQYDCFKPQSDFLRDQTTLKYWPDIRRAPDALPPVTIMTMSRYGDIFAQCAASVDKFAANISDRVLVTDGITVPAGWRGVSGKRPFIFARNWNIGMQAADPASDLLFLNDDVELLSPNSVAKLQKVAYSEPDIGIVAPQVRGVVGNELQSVNRRLQTLAESEKALAFVCVFIRRAVLDKVGPMDERFTEYGSDDVDYCRRARAAGFRLVVTPNVTVSHGFGDTKASSSFLRVMSEEQRVASMRKMRGVLEAKWQQA